MKKYSLLAGGLSSLVIVLHIINIVLSNVEFSSIWDLVPISVTWFTISVSAVLYMLDDYHNHGAFITFKQRFMSNDALEAIKITVSYSVLFHALLLVSFPKIEAFIAVLALVYFIRQSFYEKDTKKH